MKKLNYLIFFLFLFCFIILLFSLNLYIEKDVDLSKENGYFFASFYYSLTAVLINIVTVILIYRTYQNQIIQIQQQDDEKKTNEYKDEIDIICKQINILLNKKEKLNIYKDKVNFSFFKKENNLIFIPKDNIRKTVFFDYLNFCLQSLLWYITDDKEKELISSNEVLKEEFEKFIKLFDLENLDQFLNIYQNKIDYFDPNIKSDIPLNIFNFDKISLTSLRGSLVKKIFVYPNISHTRTYKYFNNFNTLINLFQLLEKLEFQLKYDKNKIFINNYKVNSLDFYKNLLIDNISIEEFVFLMNFYLYDFEKFKILNKLGIFKHFNDNNIDVYFFDYQNLKSDYLQIKKYFEV